MRNTLSKFLCRGLITARSSKISMMTQNALKTIFINIFNQAIARSNGARLVDRAEIDLRKKVWHMPTGKYKSEKAWVIPLTRAAIKILRTQRSPKYQEGRVFSTVDGSRIGDKKLSSMPKALGFDAVFNGSRSTFRTRCQKKKSTMKQQNSS